MAVNILSASPEIRERRLNSITSFKGSASELHEKSKTSSIKPAPSCYGQCSDCQEFCANTLLTFIQDAAVVCHSPIGCYSIQAVRDNGGHACARDRKLPDFKCETICTNIQERDTIYGGVEKLIKACLEVHKRANPTAIFITTSCASGIVGDDVESAATEAADELGIPVIPVSCEGFKSKIWSTGFDAAFHAIAKHIVKPAKERKKDVVNVYNFQGSDVFTPLLAKLGLKTQYVVPMNSVPQLERISEAACSATMCETLSTYVITTFSEHFGVPEVKAVPPYGIKWTDAWLREVARLTDKSDVVEKVIEEEHKRIEGPLNEYRERFKGKTIYIIAGDAFTHNLANALTDLGLTVIGINALHHDQKSDSENVDTLGTLIESVGDIKSFTVCAKQPYLILKEIKRLKPDFLITRHEGLTILGYKLGIPSTFEGDANLSVGYDGLLRLGERLWENYITRKFNKNIQEHSSFPYTDWWMNQEGDAL